MSICFKGLAKSVRFVTFLVGYFLLILYQQKSPSDKTSLGENYVKGN